MSTLKLPVTAGCLLFLFPLRHTFPEGEDRKDKEVLKGNILLLWQKLLFFVMDTWTGLFEDWLYSFRRGTINT